MFLNYDYLRKVCENVWSMGGRKICSYKAPFTHELCCDNKLGGDYRGLKGFCKECTMNQISKVCTQLTSVGENPVLVDNISQNFCRLAPHIDRMLVKNLDRRVPVIVYRDNLGNSLNETAVGLDVKLKFCNVVELDAESLLLSSSTASTMRVVAKSPSALSSAASANKSSTASSIASSSSSGKRVTPANDEHLSKKQKGYHSSADESTTSTSLTTDLPPPTLTIVTSSRGNVTEADNGPLANGVVNTTTSSTPPHRQHLLHIVNTSGQSEVNDDCSVHVAKKPKLESFIDSIPANGAMTELVDLGSRFKQLIFAKSRPSPPTAASPYLLFDTNTHTNNAMIRCITFNGDRPDTCFPISAGGKWYKMFDIVVYSISKKPVDWREEQNGLSTSFNLVNFVTFSVRDDHENRYLAIHRSKAFGTLKKDFQDYKSAYEAMFEIIISDYKTLEASSQIPLSYSYRGEADNAYPLWFGEVLLKDKFHFIHQRDEKRFVKLVHEVDAGLAKLANTKLGKISTLYLYTLSVLVLVC